VEKRIESLSGGEKSRVVLATILARPVNLLVLDEPTNHLDIRSREILLDALKEFSGTVLIVSHDRHFLRSLVGRVFEIDHGQMNTYDGTYEYYLSKTQQAAGVPNRGSDHYPEMGIMRSGQRYQQIRY
jgi:ATP-binding cassette, subfamily F, member 3